MLLVINQKIYNSPNCCVCFWPLYLMIFFNSFTLRFVRSFVGRHGCVEFIPIVTSFLSLYICWIYLSRLHSLRTNINVCRPLTAPIYRSGEKVICYTQKAMLLLKWTRSSINLPTFNVNAKTKAMLCKNPARLTLKFVKNLFFLYKKKHLNAKLSAIYLNYYCA